MKTIERVMQVITHVNIGATLGMAAWLVASGRRVVSGEWKVPLVEPRTHAPGSRGTPPASPACCLAPRAPEGRAPRRSDREADAPV